jgi:long-subunit fatty acid transport protein
MNKIINYIVAFFLVLGFMPDAQAGNPDRQGEAGFAQLLLVPYAQSAGLSAMNTAFVSGVESFGVNPAGLASVTNLEIGVHQAQYLVGTDIKLNAFGMVTKLKNGGALGISLNNVDMGDIARTTSDQPEGTGNTFSPSIFSLNIGYAKSWDEKIFVGVNFKVASERVEDMSLSTFAIDAGVQYKSGENDRFRFGVALRNIGAPAAFEGEGLIFISTVPFEGGTFTQTTIQRSSRVELQSALKLGTSYDVITGVNTLRVLANFTSNAFSRDQIGGGIEYHLKDIFVLRGGYQYELDQIDSELPIYTGVSAGATFNFKLGKSVDAARVGLGYAYRMTSKFNGTHNVGVTIEL